jgi:hypothetical protein
MFPLTVPTNLPRPFQTPVNISFILEKQRFPFDIGRLNQDSFFLRSQPVPQDHLLDMTCPCLI